MGKVPSALTYSVRQLEEALDVLLFDRRSRNAQFTAAGDELLREGRRLLQQMDTVANRVQRVASGWETQLTIAADNALAPRALLDLVAAFYDQRVDDEPGSKPPDARRIHNGPPTRLKLRNEVLSGTWEALLSGQADLALGVDLERGSTGLQCEPLGEMEFILVVAPFHPLAALPEPLSTDTLAQHRIIAVADSARGLQPVTVGVLPGQDVLTVDSMAMKLEAQIRGLGCGFLPEPMVRRHIEAGHLVRKVTEQPRRVVTPHYAWRASPVAGKALAWWLKQLGSPTTRRALVEQHEGLIL
jgi:DNA-binding transcriptional LysR family regulator